MEFSIPIIQYSRPTPVEFSDSPRGGQKLHFEKFLYCCKNYTFSQILFWVLVMEIPRAYGPWNFYNSTVRGPIPIDSVICTTNGNGFGIVPMTDKNTKRKF